MIVHVFCGIGSYSTTFSWHINTTNLETRVNWHRLMRKATLIKGGEDMEEMPVITEVGDENNTISVKQLELESE